PINQYASMPAPYTMKFIIMVWLAFLARHNPVSTMANPACMNMTRNPVTSVQTKFVAIRLWPTALTTSSSVSPFFMSATGMSAAVPVMVPAASPAAFSSGFGVGTFLMSASVIGVAAVAAGGATAGAGWVSVAGACAWTVVYDATHHTIAQAENTFFMSMFLKMSVQNRGGLIVSRLRSSGTPD